MSLYKELWIENEQCDYSIDIYDDNNDVIVTWIILSKKEFRKSI